MKLGINGRFLAVHATGVQRFALEVVTRIAAAPSDVTLFLPRGAAPPAQFAARVVHGRLRGQAFERFELPRLAGACDVLLHPANTAGSHARAIVKPRIPFVFVLHDVLPLTNSDWFDARFALWYRWTVPSTARAAARIITVSEYSRREIIRATGASPGRVLVAPQGLAPFDRPASAAEVDEVRARHALPPQFLLAVGNAARKNVVFIEAVLERWAALHGDAPALVVAGNTNGGADRQGGGTRTRWGLGRVDDRELHALYTAASALCFPSLAEGFGRPPLEAAACGTPAVVAPFPAAREVLRDTAAARIVPLDVDAWVDALRPLVHAGPHALLDSGPPVRWNWDAAAEIALDACLQAARDPAGHTVSSRKRGATRRARSNIVAVADSSMVSPMQETRPDPGGPGGLRIAFVHDWLTGMRGGERVLEELIDLYPGADVFTLVHAPGSISPSIESRVVATSFVNRLPRAGTAYRYYLPFMPAAAARLDLSGYDLVLSSSHCAAKGVHTADVPHLCYCHTPMRYLWDRSEDYFGAGRASATVRLAAAALRPALRRWDVRSAARIDRILANSRYVRDRIRACWGRDAAVVYPPVDVDRFSPATDRDDVYVIAGALVPYKRVDVAIRAFNDLGRRLLVIGDGPEYGRLRQLAGPAIEFAGRTDDADLARALARARALIMPMVEDFGIIAVEAQAAGTPVIALAEGGALETVIGWPGDDARGGSAARNATGIFFREQTPDALADAVLRTDGIAFDVLALRAHARRFDRSVFRAAIDAHVTALVAGNPPSARDAEARDHRAARGAW